MQAARSITAPVMTRSVLQKLVGYSKADWRQEGCEGPGREGDEWRVNWAERENKEGTREKEWMERDAEGKREQREESRRRRVRGRTAAFKTSKKRRGGLWCAMPDRAAAKHAGRTARTI